MSSPPLVWTLTVVFAATAGFCLLRCVVPAWIGASRAVVHRVGDCWHAVMALGMVGMLWPWGMHVPALPQNVVFGAGALFFGLQLVRPPAGHGRRALALHAVMMLAMVWMVIAMPLSMGTGFGGITPMPGMPGMPGMTVPTAATGGGLPAGVLSTGLVAALGLAAATLHWTARCIDQARTWTAPRTRPRSAGPWYSLAEIGGHGAMSLGMTVMLVAML
jgi:hypothetical protein